MSFENRRNQLRRILIFSEIIALNDENFFLQSRITDFNFEKKTIQLGFGKSVGAFLFYWILRSKNQKRRLHIVLISIDCNLSFGHYFKQCCLGFGRRTVDFINQNNI